MFVRTKKSGRYEYLQVVHNERVDGQVRQRVIATLGRMDRLTVKGDVEKLVRSLAKYSDQVLLILSGKSDAKAVNFKIGPALIFERLWQESGIKEVLEQQLANRKHTFSVERALFLTVLHRLFI